MTRPRWGRAPARALRAVVGIWVLFELRNMALTWPRALRHRRFETAEVRRATVDAPPAEVTVVIPTYRRPDTLRRAVRSALEQVGTEVAVMVVDDGGGLPALPADPRLVAVSLSRNSGCLGLVRNVGIRLAHSPYVAFLDDDNEWAPHHLRSALAALQAGADLVYTAVARMRPDGTPYDVLSRPFDRKALRETAFVDANSIVVRTGRGVRFSRLPRGRATLPKEDWEFVWRLSRRRRVVHVPEVTVRYTVNPDSYYTQWAPEPDAPSARPGEPPLSEPRAS